jgi:hypothetical protein
MPINLTPLLRAYAPFRISQLNTQGSTRDSVTATQENQLLRLIRKARKTKFGREHNFSKIKSVADFQKQVPLRKYEAMWEDYWKSSFPNLENCSWPGKVPFFALSSGTTSGTTKYIPYTKEIMNTTTRGGVDLLVHHINNKPMSNILGGKSFILTGSTDLGQLAPGIEGGDMSGICMKIMPQWARQRSFPPAGHSGIKSWESMIELFAEASLKAGVTSLNGAPSWMLLFLDKLRTLRPEWKGKLAKLYPDLELVVHGGMNFEPYKKVYSDLLEGSRAETREVYPASEGFFAVQDKGYGEGMRLIMDHGIFYEFIPMDELNSPNPTRHWLATVEKDIDYALVISTCAGLWSYIIGDMVRFVDVTPPRVLMVGRTSYMLSAVGEHVIGEELDKCLMIASQKSGLEIAEYSVGAIFPKTPQELVGHQYVIEFRNENPSEDALRILMDTLDSELQVLNEDYLAHRRNEYGLYPPKLLVARHGAFNDWMKSRGKLGGQNKVPRVINNQEIFQGLLSSVRNYNNT